MPSTASTKSSKTELIGTVKGKFDKMTSAVFLNYKGMTVEQATKLRANFRKAGVEHDVLNETPTEIVFLEVELKP